MTDLKNQVWRLQKRPQGRLQATDFSFSNEAVPEPSEGQALVRTIYLSVDPTNRIWASDMDQYMPPVEIGSIMRGGTLGIVERSLHPEYEPGDIVLGFWGWQLYAAVPGGLELRKLDPAMMKPLDASMSVLGVTGMSAYFGLLDITDPKPGETLVVSAAAGAVGSLVGQIGKIKGCRVVGIAGSAEKCDWLTSELGFDAAINYRQEDVSEALDKTCPEGVDIYFENVGGAIGDAVIRHLNLHARVSLCGLISQYNDDDAGAMAGPRSYAQLLMKRVRLEGFIVLDYIPRFPEGIMQMAQWIAEGRIRYRTHMVDGIENAFNAMDMLFTGANIGKTLVRVSPEP